MDKVLIRNWNKVVSVDDLVYHVGDFSIKGKPRKYESKLNGKVVHIKGNHDGNNKTKTCITKCMMEFGGKDVYVVHVPPETKDEIPICDFVVCGHIHEKWKYKFVKWCKVPLINVGVDVWGFTPVSMLSLLKYYEEIKSE